MATRYTQDELRAAVADSRSVAETLRRLGMCATGGNRDTLKKYAERWQVDLSYFDPAAARNEALARARRAALPLDEIMVESSTYSRGHLKRRLFDEGLKERRCELCGQDETWHGRRMSLVLDHINGVRNDHRLENLQVVCPNCAATLATHCGRQNRLDPKACRRCGKEFIPKRRSQRYCSSECGVRWVRACEREPEAGGDGTAPPG